MKNLVLLGIALLGLNNFAKADPTHYDQCNICINGDSDDPGPKETLKECKTWFRSVHSRGAYTQIVARSTVDKELAVSDAVCDHVEVYGSFHANEEFLPLPFGISYVTAQILQANTLNYTGSSCDIFQNVDQLNKYASLLSELKTKFTISGNQNMGIVYHIPVVRGWHEPAKTASKVTVTIADGKIDLAYQKCSPTKSACTLEEGSDQATTKYCSNEEGKNLVQTCCPAELGFFKKKQGLGGLWSEPGAECAQTQN